MYFIHAVPQLRPNIFCELDQFSITNSPSEETRVLNVERRPLSVLSEFWKLGQFTFTSIFGSGPKIIQG